MGNSYHVPVLLRLIAKGFAGIPVPGFSHCAPAGAHNLVLGNWGTDLPRQALLAEIGKAPEQDRGVSLMSYVHAPDYSATVVRRTRAGSAEVHKNVDDVWYVIAGGGTLVTGGSLVAGRETQAGEWRGQAVSAGTPRRIGKGDFIRIPAGIPHWVSAIDGKEIVYLVVKVEEGPYAH